MAGVTVEASSAALLEKLRSVVTDGAGRYRFADLPPGIYSLSFSLEGFKMVKRENVTLAAASTATLGAEMTVSALNQTATGNSTRPL